MSKLSAKERIYGFLDGQEDAKAGDHQDERGEYYEIGHEYEKWRQEVTQRHKISELGKLL